MLYTPGKGLAELVGVGLNAQIWQGTASSAGPTLGGQAIFGDLVSFGLYRLLGTPAAVDSWLGLVPGTTEYGPGPSGFFWGVAGAFVESTAAAVQADATRLSSWAGRSGPFAHATLERFPSGWHLEPSVFFASGDLVFDVAGIQPSLGNQYRLNYWLVLRSLAVG